MRYLASILLCFGLLPCISQKLHIDAPVKFLALGDSYTIGQSVDATGRWPVQLVSALRLRAFPCEDARIVARTGWLTSDLMSGIEDAKLSNDYTLVSLLIGVNNFFRDGGEDSYAADFEELLKTAIKLAKGQNGHVVVVSIPDYGYTPFGGADQPRISAGINSFNGVSQQIAANYGVPYVDIVEISRQGLGRPDLVAPDGLHPSAKQYRAWVDLIIRESVLTRASDNPTNPSDTIVTETEKELAGIKVYPSPFNDRLLITGIPPGGGQGLLTLSDAIGRIVMNKVIDRDLTTADLDTGNLAPGIYSCRLLTTYGVYVGRVLKAR